MSADIARCRGVCVRAAEETAEVVEAAVCGALGCRETDRLVRVVRDEIGERVLCRPHARQLLDKEGER